jgi:hypothetical protein
MPEYKKTFYGITITTKRHAWWLDHRIGYFSFAREVFVSFRKLWNE